MLLIILAQFRMNLLKKFTLPMKYWTSFLLLGISIFSIASTLLGSMLIPSFEIICPRSLPYSKAKCDLLGFREIPNFMHFKKTLSRYWRCFSLDMENTVMLSKYMTKNLSFSFEKAISMALWNVALVFINPKGILEYMNVPHGVVKVVFS